MKLRSNISITYLNSPHILFHPMRFFTALLIALIAGLGAQEVPSTFEPQNSAARAFFKAEYKQGDRFVPRWSSYLGQDKTAYEAGFNDGLTFALERFPMMGTDTAIKAKFKEIAPMPSPYRMGYLAAFEVYSAHETRTR